MKRRLISVLLAAVFAFGAFLPLASPALAASAELTFTCTSSDAQITGYHATYNNARICIPGPTGCNKFLFKSSSFNTVGQKYADGLYYVKRDFLFFDTSALPDGATITGATLKLYGYVDESVTDFDIVIQNGMPTYPHDPVVFDDFNQSLYSGDGGSMSTAGFSTVAYNEITLNADGRSWINDEGITKFILRSSRDIGSNTPTGLEQVGIYANEQGEGYQPKLVVTWTVTAPDITTNAASSVSGTTARLNASVVDDGYEACTVRWGWGKTSEASITAYDHYTAFAGSYTTGQHPYNDIDTLDVNTPYYFRVEIQNSEDTELGGELSFTTTSGVSDPTDFRAYPSATSVSLTWTKGAGTSTSIVRYRTDIYPTSYTDGTSVYEGTSSSTNHTGLSAGSTYYYAVWGKSGAVYSSGSAEVMVTTSATTEDGDNLPSPTTPLRWLTGTDYTNMSNLPIFYDSLNFTADTLDIPRATVWFAAFMGIALGCALVVYWLSMGSVFMALIALLIASAGGWAVEQIPLAIPALMLVILIAMFFAKRREAG